MGNATLEIGKEYSPEGESAVIDQLRALHLKVHQAQPGPGHRGEHPKQHAGLWATFRVAEDVPESMRVGLFATPRSYTAIVRFSNGRGQDDTKPEVHAMAVKVLVPDGTGPPGCRTSSSPTTPCSSPATSSTCSSFLSRR